MELNPQMLKWAADRVEKFKEEVRIYTNALRAAERDVKSIQSGRPSGACLDRYYDWREKQPKGKGA